MGLIHWDLMLSDIVITLSDNLAGKQAAAAAKHGNATALIRLKSESFADASRAPEIVRLFTVFTGIVRGITDNRQAMYCWLRPVVKGVSVMTQTYMLYPDVLQSLLKFLYRTSQSVLNMLEAEDARLLLISIQTVARTVVECYDVSSGELSAKRADDDAVKNISHLFK